MKQILFTAPMILCILYALFPFGRIMGAVCGYDLVLRSYPASIVALAAISIVALVLLLSSKISLNKTQTVFSALAPPLSAMNGLSFVLDSDWKATVIFALICCGCSIVISVKFAFPSALKIVSAVLSALLILLLLSFAFIDFIFGDFVLNTVVKSAASPQNTYIAEVIDNDQGALGGDTFVDVRDNRKAIDLFICKFSKSPTRVYTGKWGEFKNMQISWKDEHTLMIDNREYHISD